MLMERFRVFGENSLGLHAFLSAKTSYRCLFVQFVVMIGMLQRTFISLLLLVEWFTLLYFVECLWNFFSYSHMSFTVESFVAV